jgi:hypothetical protein
MGYEVVIDKIRRTGQAATRVADGLRGVDCSATIPGGDAGMPGARCVAKLAAVKQEWLGREQGFVTELEQHAANVGKAADLYSSNEQAAARDMTVKEPATSGPRPV